MTTILAIDPGTEQSAWVLYRTDGQLLGFGKQPNHRILEVIRQEDYSRAVIERVESYGMPVGREVFETVQWTGRFIEAIDGVGHPVATLPRRSVKLALCGSPKANDATIRQALIDRFPGPLSPAAGNPTKGHPLFGISGDVWQALAVAVTWHDEQGAAA